MGNGVGLGRTATWCKATGKYIVRYFANDHEVDEATYKALGGTILTCGPRDCDKGGVTLDDGCASYFFDDAGHCVAYKPKPAPKLKTRGEEVADRLKDVSQSPFIFHECVAQVIDREIATAEKRGEDRVKEKVKSHAEFLRGVEKTYRSKSLPPRIDKQARDAAYIYRNCAEGLEAISE
jgi:hypothetical protein